jgi:RNAse (barnase) inhibitor barstar
MKTRKTLIAILAMAVLVTAVTVVSCKKENENALVTNSNTQQQAFDFRQIKDLDAYFKDFRQKMAESKSDEAMNLGDAAWHLASLANIDFCNVNVEYNDVQFDTIVMQVNVTNGTMLMSDLHTAYEQMCTEIQNFMKSFNHYNQNLYFINAFINQSGIAKITIKTTFVSFSKGLEDHLWYFPDTFCYIDSVCDAYFTSDSSYQWNTTAKRELQRILNIFEHHENQPGVIKYIPSRTYVFEYPDWPDPYGSEFDCNSRLFAELSYESNLNYNLPLDEMCYCLDSYLGLGHDYMSNNFYINNERPMNWIVMDTTRHFSTPRLYYCYHKLKVEYGYRLSVIPPTPDPD